MSVSSSKIPEEDEGSSRDVSTRISLGLKRSFECDRSCGWKVEPFRSRRRHEASDCGCEELDDGATSDSFIRVRVDACGMETPRRREVDCGHGLVSR